MKEKENNLKENRLITYYMNIYNDFLFFSNDIDNILLEIDKEYLTSDIYLSNLFLKLKDLETEQYYPEKCINNLEKILNFISHNSDNELVNNLLNLYDKIKNMPSTNNIYFYEYCLKFVNIRDITNLTNIDNYIDIIETSIYFDLKAIKDILSDDEEIEENAYYIYSIKKFLKDLPEMFLDKNVNENTLKILDKNIKYEDASMLRYKVENITKYNNIYFDFPIFKSFYDYIVLQNMMIDSSFLMQNKALIDKDIIKNVYLFIDENFIYDERCKRNILKVMNVYRQSISKNKDELKEYNSYLCKLNILDTYKNNMLISEYFIRSNKGYSINRLFKIIDNIDELIKNDLLILNLYLCDKDEYAVKKGQLNKLQINLSINKFLKIIPSMFDDETIYERTMEILEDKKIKNKIKKITMRR